jgi:hypothetical protein
MSDHPMALANSGPEAGTIVSEAVLTQILTQLESLTISQQVLQAKVRRLWSITRLSHVFCSRDVR